jgi:dinuclear metal center YbgI/SA1388 family protein
MLVRDVQEIFESWAPKEIAWEKDNVGLQVGSRDKPVKRILVTLDVTDEAIREAVVKKADLLVSHHPLLFHPLRTVDPTQRVGRLLTELIRNDLALYAAHTNLDFTKGGVSFALGERLGLQKMEILQRDSRSLLKIAVFVPTDDVEKVSGAMSKAGAGWIGKYAECSFRAEGTGTFTPLDGARPAIGKRGKRSSVREMRLEMILPSWKLPGVVGAMLDAHPYEEVAYDVYRLENVNRNVGAGVVGELRRKMTLSAFLGIVRKSLRTPSLRYAGAANSTVGRVAVCGGSGGSFIPSAISSGADVYVTADLSYHTFQEHENKIALVDAGHFETEQPAIEIIVNHLRAVLRERRERCEVFAASRPRNVVQYSLS